MEKRPIYANTFFNIAVWFAAFAFAVVAAAANAASYGPTPSRELLFIVHPLLTATLFAFNFAFSAIRGKRALIRSAISTVAVIALIALCEALIWYASPVNGVFSTLDAAVSLAERAAEAVICTVLYVILYFRYLHGRWQREAEQYETLNSSIDDYSDIFSKMRAANDMDEELSDIRIRVKSGHKQWKRQADAIASEEKKAIKLREKQSADSAKQSAPVLDGGAQSAASLLGSALADELADDENALPSSDGSDTVKEQEAVTAK